MAFVIKEEPTRIGSSSNSSNTAANDAAAAVATSMYNSENNTQDEEDNFLRLPPKLASRATFPPGCPVILCWYEKDTNNNSNNSNNTKAEQPPQVLYGTVAQVGISLAENYNRETLFQVKATMATKTVAVPANDLQFGVGTPVWLWCSVNSSNGSSGTSASREGEWQPGVVVGSDHLPPTPGVQIQPNIHYSVQRLTGATVHHAIRAERISYRSTDGQEGPPPRPPALVSTTRSAAGAAPQQQQQPVLPRPPAVVGGARRVSVLPSEEALGVCTDGNIHFSGEDYAASKSTDCHSQSTTQGTHSASVHDRVQHLVHAAATTRCSSPADAPSPPAPPKKKLRIRLSLTKANKAAMVTANKANVPTERSNVLASLLSSTTAEATAANSSPSNIEASTAVTARYVVAALKTARPSEERNPVSSRQQAGPHSPSTAMSTYGRRQATENVMNPYPSPLQYIQYQGLHKCTSALYELRMLLKQKGCYQSGNGGVGANVYRSCLMWHLFGRCRSTCIRSVDHVELSPTRASALEEDLQPVISPTGPIVGRLRGASDHDRGNEGKVNYDVCSENEREGRYNNSSNANAYGDRRDVSNHEQHHRTDRSGGRDQMRHADHHDFDSRSDDRKRSSEVMQHRWDRPQDNGSSENIVPTGSKPHIVLHAQPLARFGADYAASFHAITIRLPVPFGTAFLVDVIMGNDGAAAQKLCDRHDCMLQMEGSAIRDIDPYYKPPAGESVERLAVKVQGIDMPKITQCIYAIEDAIFQAVPQTLRVYLLSYLAGLNNYRDKRGGLIHSRNPCSAQDDPDDMFHMKAKKAPLRLINSDEGRQLKRDLEQRYPLCKISMIGDSHRDSFPLVRPHVSICSCRNDQAHNCSKDLDAWLKMRCW